MVGGRGTWLQLVCCAASRCCVPNFRRQGSLGDRRSESEMTLLSRQKLDKDDKEKLPSHRARRGLKRLMFREDYV